MSCWRLGALAGPCRILVAGIRGSRRRACPFNPADLLPDAVDALEALATGLPTNRLQALAGAFALDSLSIKTEAVTGLPIHDLTELADAAQTLYHIAAGGHCRIEAPGKARLVELACAVREFIGCRRLAPTLH
jgi:hypothetical protein